LLTPLPFPGACENDTLKEVNRTGLVFARDAKLRPA